MQPLFRLYRQARGITQARLARLTGIPQPVISIIESGDHNPSDAQLTAIAAILDVDPAYLLLQPVADEAGT